jgi:putative hydrolase of the HAD superfamily
MNRRDPLEAMMAAAPVPRGPMKQRAFDLIAFDADDTLWHNERSYQLGRDRFRRLLTEAGVTLGEEEVDDQVNRTELQNIRYYGYGVSSFVLSLIETAIILTGGRVNGGELQGLIDMAKQMLTEEVELFEGAREAVTALAASYPLIVVTKGDLLHQTSKVDRSGLRDRFRCVDVVSHKTADVYASILAREGVEPGRFLMVGNSLRSDILPVVELGGWAVHVPAALSWSHEDAQVPEPAKRRTFELDTLARLPGLVRHLEDGGWPT